VADEADGPAWPETWRSSRASFSTGPDVAGADDESRERRRDKLTAAVDAGWSFAECRRFTFIVVTMLDALPRGKLVDGAVLEGTSGGAQRRDTVAA